MTHGFRGFTAPVVGAVVVLWMGVAGAATGVHGFRNGNVLGNTVGIQALESSQTKDILDFVGNFDPFSGRALFQAPIEPGTISQDAIDQELDQRFLASALVFDNAFIKSGVRVMFLQRDPVKNIDGQLPCVVLFELCFQGL